MELNHANINIWQQNLNKSPISQHDIISSKYLTDIGTNIVALQEPAINFLHKTITTKDWVPIYPSMHSKQPDKTRSIILISTALTSDSWQQLDFPSGDVTIIQVKGEWGKLTIFNIYNDGQHNSTVNLLTKYTHKNANTLGNAKTGNVHVLWLGDFNRHHPYWDDLADMRLFTNEATNVAEILIRAIAEAGLEMVLPSGTPTHLHNVSKWWSRLDNIFLLDHSLDALISCDTVPKQCGIHTDHLLILTKLVLTASTTPPKTTHNFRETDWEQFHSTAEAKLLSLDLPSAITMQAQLVIVCC